MAEDAKITLYDVKHCGLYGGRGGQPLAATLSEVFPALAEWSRGKELTETKTYTPAPDSNLLPAYLLQLVELRGCWLVSIWNEVPATEGGVASVPGRAVVGQATANLTRVRPGDIPGFPTYFWVDVAAGTVASVKFNHLLGGMNQFNRYLSSFIEIAPNWCVFADPPPTDGSIQIEGYRVAGNDEPQNLFARFNATLVTNKGPVDEFRQRVRDITKIHRKVELSMHRREQIAMFQKLLRATGMRHLPERQERVRLNYEVAVSITLDQLNEIIEEHNADNYISQWEDVGLQFKGESTPKWLSRAIARSDFALDVRCDDAGLVNAQQLAEELLRHRGAINSLRRQ